VSTQTPQQSATEQLVTADQAAELIGCHRKTFDERVRRGAIHAVVPGAKGRGRVSLFARADIARLLAEVENWRHERRTAQQAELRELERRLGYGPKPLPPEPVRCPLEPGLEHRIVEAHKRMETAEWLEEVGEDWLANAGQVAPDSVATSMERFPSVREAAISDRRVDHAKHADPTKNYIMSLDFGWDG
jgi:hypothetical protein